MSYKFSFFLPNGSNAYMIIYINSLEIFKYDLVLCFEFLHAFDLLVNNIKGSRFGSFITIIPFDINDAIEY